MIILLLSVFIALLGIGTRGFCQPVVGSLSDRWGRKGFLIAGLFIYGLVGLVLPEAGSVANLILIRTFHGFGSAMIVPVAMAYVGELAPQGREGRYMGLLNVAIFTGIGGGPMLGGFFADLWGMASAFYAILPGGP